MSVIATGDGMSAVFLSLLIPVVWVVGLYVLYRVIKWLRGKRKREKTVSLTS